MTDLIVRKAQELSLALLKVAAYIRRFELRQRIEKLSYHLLENISYQNPEIAINTIAAIRNFVILGKNIYEIEPKNAAILERELDMLYKEIKHFAGIGDSLNVESFFTVRVPIINSEKENKPKSVELKHPPAEIVVDDAEIGNEAIEYGKEDNKAIDYTANYRQEKMIAMIATSAERQLQLRDFIAAFPELSERTIRYDLKKLADTGRIIREGSGGPSNYYRLGQ